MRLAGRRGRALALVGALWLALALAPDVAQAEGPYEPNDGIPGAAGPLLSGQTVHAALEAEGDKDFFYFYVGAAEKAHAVLTVEDLGGGSNPLAEMDARITDSHGTYVGGDFVYMRPGESRTSTVVLNPGKYFVEIVPRSGYGDSYNLVPSSADGAFIGYGAIAGRCATATAKVEALRRQMHRLKAKLARAVSRLRRSLFASRKEREAARALYERAKARVRAQRRALEVAIRAQSPWCYIPQ